MKKKLLIVIAALCSTMLLSGCAQVVFTFRVRPDLSGEVEVQVGFAKEVYEAFYTTPEEVFSDDTLQDILPGDSFKYHKTVQYSNDRYAGIVVYGDMPDFAEEGIEGVSDEPIVTKADGKVRVEFSVKEITEDIQKVSETYGDITDSLDVRIVLEVPVAAMDSNATSVSADGKTLTWNLAALQGETIYAEFPASLPVWAIILIVIGALIIVAAVVFIIIRKKKAASADKPKPAFDIDRSSLASDIDDVLKLDNKE